MTDQELKDLVASLAINQQKMSEEAALSRAEAALSREAAALYRTESALSREEAALSRKETDIGFKELREAQRETDKQLRETDKQIRELKKQIGGIANKFGSFTEGLALPSMTKILSEKFGMTTINPSVRVKDKSGNEHEIDVLAYNNGEANMAFIVEVKSHLREEGIEQLLKQLNAFPDWFPELANKKLYGILAAVDANQELKQRVLNQGLYFAKIHDEQFSLAVPKNFQARCFNPR